MTYPEQPERYPGDDPYGSPPAGGYVPDAYAPPPAPEYGAPPPYGAAPPEQIPPMYGTPPPTAPYVPAPPYRIQPAGEANGLGVAALVFACLGLVCTGLPSLVGLALSLKARQAVTQGRATNSGVVTTALVISSIGVGFWLLVFLASIVSS